ncbi:SURF1 family protein [Novosphingobium sp. SL115]|uniref:SURF1 family protein n=1 Tax=Novosphingobium sp. SL115 TaxID=2995150 RepID=UPI002274B1D4|nr:SURF1 family protein [Novosphingobium sp. SL115]MCY1671118.1 SURF1 family protein [Novosphingobium sp. SL115]
MRRHGMRKLPILPTMFVAAAAAVMVVLGVWQMQRLHQKEAMLARYQAAQASATEVSWPGRGAGAEMALYHRSRVDCRTVAGMTTVSGRNVAGEAGLAHVADCRLADGSAVPVSLGWSRNPASPAWSGGAVTGWIAPGPKLVADPAQAGLEGNARPDPRDMPNNHLAYAVQWFFFAGVALVIYGLALRGRWREKR